MRARMSQAVGIAVGNGDLVVALFDVIVLKAGMLSAAARLPWLGSSLDSKVLWLTAGRSADSAELRMSC